MRADDAFFDALDELRRLMDPVPTKSDAIRAAVMSELERRKRRVARKAEDCGTNVLDTV